MNGFPLPRTTYWAAFMAVLLFFTSPSAEAVDFGASQVQSGAGSYSSLAIDSANTKHLATYDATNGSLLYGVQPHLFGWTFETVDGSAAADDVGQFCSIALDASGDPHIAYYDASTGAVRYAHKSGGAWSDIEIVDAVTGGPNTSLALDSFGNPHIAYTEGGVMYAHKSGGVWSTQLISPGFADDIAIDRLNRVHIVLHTKNPTHTVIDYAIQIVGGGWSIEEVEDIPGDTSFSGAISLDVDVSGNPHVSYAGACDLRYAHRSPIGGWSIETADGVSGVVKATSIRLDKDRNPRIAYQVDTISACSFVPEILGELYFAYKTNGHWMRQLVEAGVTTSSGISPSLALTQFYSPAIAYGDGSSGTSLYVAEGNLLNVWFTSPNATKPSDVDIRTFGSAVDAPPSVAQLRNGAAVYNSTGVAVVLDSDHIDLSFDLTGAPSGAYDLILVNPAGADTLPDAVLVHGETVDLTRLTTDMAPEITPAITGPDAPNRLVFASGREGTQDLFVRGLGGVFNEDLSAYRLSNSGSAQFPSWRADGSQLVYHEATVDRLFVLDGTSGAILAPAAPVITPGAARNPSWNPVTGTLIAYDDGTSIGMIHYPSNILEPVSFPGIDPDWAPDGQHLVYSVDEGDNGISIRMRKVLPMGSETVLVPAQGFQNFGPQWSPDGNWVAFSTNRPSGTEYNVYVTDSQGQGWLIPITTNASANEAQVTWSQDGQTLSFISNVSGNGDVVQASDLPIFLDSDSDGIPDIVDVCPGTQLNLGQIDQNFDGCPDAGSSFRFTRFWALNRFPLTIETSATGDPLISDGSEFMQYSLAFASWQSQGEAIQANFVGGGLENAVSGDVRNSVTFTDQDGFLLGTVAITFSTVADDDTTIGGRLFHKNEVIDSDVLFNTQHYAFSTPSVAGPAGSFSLRNVAAHELGHFFGFGHSSIQTSTMFYVAYRDTVQTSLEADDIVLVRHGYHGQLDAPILSIEGRILRGEDGVTPVPGAAVFAITAQDDTVQMTVSGVDGTYRFWDLPGNVRVFVAPLDGTGTVNGLTPGGISAALDDVAETNFLPEYYDGPTETNADIGSAGILIQAYPELAANIITNPDLIGPIVVSTSPEEDSGDVPATTTIVIGFSERIAIDSVSGNLHLENQTTSTGVAGTAAFLTPSNLLVFTPTAPLDFSTPYLFTVDTGITDETGNPLAAPVILSFATQAQPPLVILAAAPAEVPIGGTLVLSGTGFSPIAANNVVNFTGGTTATPYAATLEQLFVSVPAGTQSGNLNVVVGAMSSNDFSIVVVPPLSPPVGVLLGAGTLAGDPRKVSLHPNGAWAYVATSAGVTAVDALPSSATFLDATQISIPGGTVGVAALPDGQRVLALATNPPSLEVIDAVVTSSFFNTVVQSVPLPEAPLGIAAHPGGTSVLVSYPGRVAAYNVVAGGSFGVEIRQWSQEGVSFLGDISISPDAAQAYAAASGGKVAVLGLASGEGVVALLAAGTTPHETAGSPLANAFFSADESGTVSRFAPRGPLEGSLTEGGSYNGLAVSPDGSFVYALNYTLNRVDVMDAFSITPTLVTSFDTGVDPVDLAVGSGGRYFYVAVDATNVLQVYDAESGVLVTSVFPRSGGDQTLITIAGSGFDPVPAMNTVEIGEATATVVSASSTALTVLQPGVVSGALRVTAGGENSNPISYKGVDLDETPFVGMGALNETIIPEIETLLETPGGRWLVGVRVDGSMTVIGADPALPDFLQPVQELSAAETQLNVNGFMAVTPDGRKLYVTQGESNEVAIFSLTGPPTAPLSRSGTISSGVANLGASDLAVTPDGSRLLLLSEMDEVVYEVATTNDSLLNTGSADAMGGLNNPLGMVIDPRGTRVYVGHTVSGSTEIGVFDLVSTSGTYRDLLTTYPVGSGFSIRIAASPRGDFIYSTRLYVLAVNSQYFVSLIDIRPGSLTLGQVLATQAVGLDFGPVVLPNHSGNAVFVLAGDAPGSLAAYSGDETFTPLGLGPSSARLSGRSSLVASMDDARLYVPALGGGIYATDVSGVNSFHITSGDGQIGVANQPLPAPLVVDAQRLGGAPAEGTLVTYTGISGNFGPGITTFITATDAAGFAEANYINGPGIDADRIDATSAAGTLQFFPIVVGDTTAAPPQLLAVIPGPNDQPGNLTNIAVDFSKAIVSGTVNVGTFSVTPVGGSALAGTYTFANQGRRIVFDPAAPLDFNATYDVVVTAGLLDYNSNPLMNPGTSTFTTGTAPLLSLAAVNAPAALPGNIIVLSGSGFSDVEAENTIVFSGDVAVTPSTADPGALSVPVPSTALSGTVLVVVGPDSSNSMPFTVLGQVTPLNEPLDVISVPSSGQSIAVLPNGTRAYMTSPGANAVVPILIATAAAETPIAVGQYPFGVAPAPNSTKVYISNFLSNTISVIGTDPADAGFHTVLSTIPTGLNPSGLVVHPDGRTLYVCNYGSETVSFIDIDPTSATYNMAKADINVGSTSKAVGVSPDGTTLIVGTENSVLLLNTADGSAKADINVGSSSKGVGVSPDGAFAVVLLDNGDLVLIDIRPGVPLDERAKAEVNVGSSSKGVGVSPDGGSVYITQADGRVDIYAIVALGSSAARDRAITSPFEFQFVTSIQVGENPAGLAFDKTTGLLLVVNSGDNTVSFINAGAVSAGDVIAKVDIDPNSIQPGSKGKFISAYLQFPVWLSPFDVVLSTVRLNGTIPADTQTSAVLDHDLDGILERQVRFDRVAVQALIPPGDPVQVTVTGQVDGRTFAGYDSIKVLPPKIKNPHAGLIAPQLSELDIQWSPNGQGIDGRMDIFWSRDRGNTWETIVHGTEDDSSYVWTVPDVLSSRDCLVQLVARNKNGQVTGVEIMAEPFTISSAPLGVEETLPVRFALHPAAPNPFAALGTKVRFDLPEASSVSLRVYGVDGGVIRTLARNEPYPAGRHTFSWDGRTDQGQPVHGGVYFLRIEAGPKAAVQKIVRVTR